MAFINSKINGASKTVDFYDYCKCPTCYLFFNTFCATIARKTTRLQTRR